ncbi:hypothetical protein D9M72_645850 [compost metagenome]
MFLRELVDADVVAAEHVTIACQSQQIRGQHLTAGIDDRAGFGWDGDDGRNHRQRAFIPVCHTARHQRTVVVDIGAGAIFAGNRRSGGVHHARRAA